MTDVILSNTTEHIVSFQIPWKSDKRLKVNKPPEPIDIPPKGWRRVDERTYGKIKLRVESAQAKGMIEVAPARASEDADQGALEVSE